MPIPSSILLGSEPVKITPVSQQTESDTLDAKHHCSTRVEKHVLLSVVLPAHAVSPFPLWLKKWQPLGSSTFGYTLLSMRLLQHRCIFVNMWDAQLNGLQTGAEMRRVLTALRAGHGQMQPSPSSKPPETPLVGRSLSSTFGRPRKKPTLVTRTMDSVTLQRLLHACRGGPRMVGWTQRGLCARSSDGELLAALAKTPCKDLSRHLVTDLEDKHRRLAAATSVYSLFVVLAGALEFQLSNRAPQVARAGTVIAFAGCWSRGAGAAGHHILVGNCARSSSSRRAGHAQNCPPA